MKNINIKVKKLIVKFNKVQDRYISESVSILNQIIDLRKIQNPKYSILDLEKEKGLEEHKNKIRSFLRFDNVSDRVQKLYEKDKLRASTLFLITNLPSITKKEIDKVVDKIIDGSISNKDLIGDEFILLKKVGINPIKLYDRIILRTIYQIKSICKIIEKHHTIFNNRKKEMLLNELDELNKLISKYIGK